MTVPAPARRQTAPRGGRLVWMDQLRGVAILLVVAFHGKTVLGRFVAEIPEPLDAALDLFAPFRMPLLTSLSGMLLGVALSKPLRAYAVGKLRRIAWPYVVWSVVFLVVADRLSAGRLLLLVHDPPPHLWFLRDLLVFYALAGLLVAARVPLAAAGALSFALSSLVEGYHVQRASFLFAFFVAGHLYARHQDRITFRARRAWSVGSAVIAAGSATASAADIDLKYEPALVFAPVSGIVLCLLVAPTGVPARAGRALAVVGRSSMVFYVVHYPVLWAWAATLTGLGVTAVLPLYVGGCAVALAAGAALSAGRRQSRVVDALFVWPTPLLAAATGSHTCPAAAAASRGHRRGGATGGGQRRTDRRDRHLPFPGAAGAVTALRR